MKKNLLVLLGATGVGKTELSLLLAQQYHCSIISADSRQCFKGLEIGTAAPSAAQLAAVPHHLVGMLGIEDYYSASQFEQDALHILEQQYSTQNIVIATGGSMLYLDALCQGIDCIPTIDESIRTQLWFLYTEEGIDPIRMQLKLLDPQFYADVDLKNHKRIIHALEVCLMTGKPYSSFRTKEKKIRPFTILKIGLMRNREQLYARINSRVEEMMANGLLDEAKKYYPQRHLNALNTVGYKELFSYLSGECSLDFAIEKIKQHSRIYSRKQMTWFKRDASIHWINLSEYDETAALSKIVELVAAN